LSCALAGEAYDLVAIGVVCVLGPLHTVGLLVTHSLSGPQLQFFSAKVFDPVVLPVVPVAMQNIAVPVTAQLTE
jgi:hypothetical protein